MLPKTVSSERKRECTEQYQIILLDAFPNIFTFLHIFLALPVTTCTTEWFFLPYTD